MAVFETVPDAVREAVERSYPIAITGFLFAPEMHGFCLCGRVFFDQKERFKTGRLIRTSTVIEFIEANGYPVALTYSGSAYVLVAEDGPWNGQWPDVGGMSDAAGHC